MEIMATPGVWNVVDGVSTLKDEGLKIFLDGTI